MTGKPSGHPNFHHHSQGRSALFFRFFYAQLYKINVLYSTGEWEQKITEGLRFAVRFRPLWGCFHCTAPLCIFRYANGGRNPHLVLTGLFLSVHIVCLSGISMPFVLLLFFVGDQNNSSNSVVSNDALVVSKISIGSRGEVMLGIYTECGYIKSKSHKRHPNRASHSMVPDKRPPQPVFDRGA